MTFVVASHEAIPAMSPMAPAAAAACTRFA
jgi:hypothetical protein